MTVTDRASGPVRHRLSTEDFYAVCDRDPARFEHYELVNGEMYEPMAESIVHATLAHDVYDWLCGQYDRAQVWMAGSVELDGDGQVRPDVYVVRLDAEPGTYWKGTELLLAVEVSVTTFAFDTTEKLANYARGGVPDYWVLDASAAPVVMVHRFTDAHGFVYRSRDVVESGEAFPPLS